MDSNTKELVIIGAGPSALAASIYTTREDVPTTLYERAVVGGLVAITDQIDNYPGYAEGIAGMKLASELQQQAERFGAEIEYGEVSGLKQDGDEVELIVDEKPVRAKAVLIATGSNHRELGVPGEKELYGRGVHYCATCDGAFYRDKELIVVGGGNSAVQEAIFLTRYASHIHMMVRSKFRASDVLQQELQKYIDEGKITVHIGATTDEVLIEDDKFAGIKTTKDGEQTELKGDALFVFIGLIPNTQFLQESEVELDPQGHVITNEKLETNVKGVFASGDVRSGSTMQIATAVGEGASAALVIREYLDELARQK